MELAQGNWLAQSARQASELNLCVPHSLSRFSLFKLSQLASLVRFFLASFVSQSCVHCAGQAGESELALGWPGSTWPPLRAASTLPTIEEILINVEGRRRRQLALALMRASCSQAVIASRASFFPPICFYWGKLFLRSPCLYCWL